MTMLFPHIFFALVLLNYVIISFADDGAVMADLLRGFTTPPAGWDSKKPYCQWEKVDCDGSGNVIAIDLSTKSISGTLPGNLNKLSSLQIFIVLRNSLRGQIPSFAELKNLREIDLGSNSFDSMAKDFLKGLTSLQELNLSNNTNLAPWQLTTSLGDCSSLKIFSAPSSKLTGSLPDVFDKLPNLENLRLSFNNLTGELPPSLGKSGLKNLWLNNQDMGLTGTISVLSSMTQLSQVWLHANAFTGSIPDLSKNKNLFDLQLRDNRLTGPVPQSLWSMPSLVNVTLSNNKFQGEMPQPRNGMQVTLGNENNFCNPTPGPCDPQVSILIEIAGGFGYPMSLAESWGGNDACKGWKSITCDAQMKSVTVANFAKQGMTGTISPAFSKLVSLESIWLNDNSLTDEIPQSLTSLPKLQLIDVSNNNLSGPIPTFSGTVKFSYGGNPFIGKNLKGGGSGGSGSVSGLAIGGIVSGIVVIIIGILSFLLYRSRQGHKRFTRVGAYGKGSGTGKYSERSVEDGHLAGNDDFSQRSGMQQMEGGNIVFSYHELREVTDNFSDKKVLGRGGFGIVYEGKLDDGTKIAVKRMESGLMGTKGMQEFQAEISVLTKVRHRHLVALLGYCVNGHERMLVYEFMPQGTLSQHLFEHDENGFQPLSWKQRVAISLDVARGVEYLHTLAQQSFIHRDLKPSNVLLDNDMRAKVADFGLVKNTDSKNSIETKLAGTFGYLAPEYAATGRVTTKVDVYAFGVILMELVSGRKALDDDRTHLVTWFRKVIVDKAKLRKEVDPIIKLDAETFESVCKVAELAGHCTARDSSQRPDMGHAVNVLSPLVQQWKPSAFDEEEAYGIDEDISLPEALQKWQDDDTSSFFDESYTESQPRRPR